MIDTGLLERLSCSIPCQCKWKKRCQAGVIVDLSFEGALVARSSSIPPLGSRVTVQLGPEAERITFTGKTAYVQEKPGLLFGIEFSGKPEKNLEKFKHALPFLS
ncbi:MAG TPA: PilZ domain-containing protein [Acidobacteriota bacterium]|nr:PilZ domain-containing protein [Acidobacteriota bacterium]